MRIRWFTSVALVTFITGCTFTINEPKTTDTTQTKVVLIASDTGTTASGCYINVAVTLATVGNVSTVTPIAIGEKRQFGFTLSSTPVGCVKVSDFVWSSSNTSVLIVDQTGLVVGVGGGDANVSLSYPPDVKIKVSVAQQVTGAVGSNPIVGVTVSPTTDSLVIPTPKTPNVCIRYLDLTMKCGAQAAGLFVCTSADTNVVKVNATTCLETPLAVGAVNITVSVITPTGTLITMQFVSVKAPVVSAFTLDYTPAGGVVGATPVALTAVCTQGGVVVACPTSLYWTSDNAAKIGVVGSGTTVIGSSTYATGVVGTLTRLTPTAGSIASICVQLSPQVGVPKTCHGWTT